MRCGETGRRPGFVSGWEEGTGSSRRSHVQTGTVENRWTRSDHAVGQEEPLELPDRFERAVSLRSQSRFWITAEKILPKV